MTEKDYRKEGEEMEKKKKKKYSRTDKVILGIGFTILGLFVLSIAIPIIYVVLASFMDPTVLNNQGLSFNIYMYYIIIIYITYIRMENID